VEQDRCTGGSSKRRDPFAELKSSSEEYAVYDSHYERIGKVDDVLLDELDRVTYVGVKMGFFGTNSTLIPVELVRINDKRRLIEVAESKETIRHAPTSARTRPSLLNSRTGYVLTSGWNPCTPPLSRRVRIPQLLQTRAASVPTSAWTWSRASGRGPRKRACCVNRSR
jgi:hypothetical protein